MNPNLEQQLIGLKAAARKLQSLKDEIFQEVLTDLSRQVMADEKEILSANELDLARMDPSNPKYDRLKLTPLRLKGIADGVGDVARLESPLGRMLMHTQRPNGLVIERVSVPFGVVCIIFEARPNVCLDVFSICLKSGNACCLKGGSDARQTNLRIVGIIKEVLERHGLDTSTVEYMDIDHEETQQLLSATEYVDLVIPRGSSRLIEAVRKSAKVPVIETGAGICHTYVDKDADIDMAGRIVLNAKTRRVSVCNALDCMILHKDRLGDLPHIAEPLKDKHVIIHADERAYKALSGSYPEDLLVKATPESFGTEFLDYKMSIKTVDCIEEALDHIALNSSRHSECIVTEDAASASRFIETVDAACVYHNAPTSFSDGGEFGLGAEIGISTQKLHARGPMGLEALTTYKWIIKGSGQIRS